MWGHGDMGTRGPGAISGVAGTRARGTDVEKVLKKTIRFRF